MMINANHNFNQTKHKLLSFFAMKGKQMNSSIFYTVYFSASRIRLTKWKSFSHSIVLIYLLTATVFLPHLIFCQTDSNVTETATVVLKNVTTKPESVKSNISSSSVGTSFSSSTEEDYYYYSDYDGNPNSTHKWYGRRSKNSRKVQAVVYCSVILISLVGILIKYFVTHYETSQIKAQEQLHYQRLHNQVT